MKDIPEDIKKTIVNLSRLRDVPEDIEEIMEENPEINYAAAYGYYGYSLSQEQLAAKEKEIERLKALVQKVCNDNFSFRNKKNRETAWQQFKAENKI